MTPSHMVFDNQYTRRLSFEMFAHDADLRDLVIYWLQFVS